MQIMRGGDTFGANGEGSPGAHLSAFFHVGAREMTQRRRGEELNLRSRGERERERRCGGRKKGEGSKWKDRVAANPHGRPSFTDVLSFVAHDDDAECTGCRKGEGFAKDGKTLCLEPKASNGRFG